MKYLFLSDIEYIIHKRKRIILIFMFMVGMSILLGDVSSNTFQSFIETSLGTTLDLSEYGILELLMYLLNVSIFLFIVVDIYIKDFCYNLDNLFLRTNPVRWFLKKSISFILFMLILKLLEYALVFILANMVYSGASNIYEFIYLILKDTGYIVFLQFLMLTFYLILNVFSCNYNYSVILLIVFLLCFDKNICQCNEYKIFFGWIITFMLDNLLIKWKAKRIIEINWR